MDEPKVTIPAMLQHWAAHEPDTAAFIFVDACMRRRVLTRADVYRLASRFAAVLRRNDVRAGDIICNSLPNSPERVVSDMGIILAGAAAMNGQIFLADGEDFIGSLKDSKCKAVILDPLQPKGAAFVLNKLEKENLKDGKARFTKLPALRSIIECHCEGGGEQLSFLAKLDRERDTFVADVNADDIAYIWTTSGSTGFSKLVPQSHARVCGFMRNFSAACGMPRKRVFAETTETGSSLEDKNSLPKENNRDDDRKHEGANSSDINISQDSVSRKSGEIKADGDTSVTPEPPSPGRVKDTNSSSSRETRYASHVYFNIGKLGWSGGFPAGFLWHGATRVLVDLSRGAPDDPTAFLWTLAVQEGCQYAFLVPFQLQQFLARDELWKGSEFRFKAIGLAGQPVHRSLLKHPALRRVCESVNVFYGSTDLGTLTCIFDVDPDVYEDGNNGKPFPGVEIKIVDENLQEIPQRRELGEVLLRSNMALTYYLSNEDATQKTLLADGWCRSGDVGFISEEGDLYVICRSSFAIMRGAYLVFPGWLENRIKTHPAVREVLVVPVPDPVLHQELCACVVTNHEAEVAEEDLRAFCEALFLTERNDHMTIVPKYFLFFSEFATTATGKLCRQSTVTEATKRLVQLGALAPKEG